MLHFPKPENNPVNIIGKRKEEEEIPEIKKNISEISEKKSATYFNFIAETRGSRFVSIKTGHNIDKGTLFLSYTENELKTIVEGKSTFIRRVSKTLEEINEMNETAVSLGFEFKNDYKFYNKDE